jgi:exodeoxyribonuclease VII small subunit
MTENKESKELSFEDGMKRLEKIVQDMEEGNLSLEKSMAAFEEGMQVVKGCQGKLDAVEKKIEILGQAEVE